MLKGWSLLLLGEEKLQPEGVVHRPAGSGLRLLSMEFKSGPWIFWQIG